MSGKIVVNHSSPFKLAGVRALLERIAAFTAVARVIPGRMSRTGEGGPLRLTDAGIPAGPGGHKYIVFSQGTAVELFVVAVAGQQLAAQTAIAGLPEYTAQGNQRRQQVAAAADARAARLAAARLHHGPASRRLASQPATPPPTQRPSQSLPKRSSSRRQP
jgi:hypothetical protein